jgi:protein involved in polysaccharide export with SLBB domain
MLPGDEVTIPIRPNTVEVRGAVANDGLIQYAAGRRVSYYLDRAGGIADNAEDVFVTQASGAVFKLRRGLFAQNPVVDDGGIIYVSQKEERPAGGADIGNVLRDTLAIAASAVTVIVPIILAFRN